MLLISRSLRDSEGYVFPSAAYLHAAFLASSEGAWGIQQRRGTPRHNGCRFFVVCDYSLCRNRRRYKPGARNSLTRLASQKGSALTRSSTPTRYSFREGCLISSVCCDSCDSSHDSSLCLTFRAPAIHSVAPR